MLAELERTISPDVVEISVPLQARKVAATLRAKLHPSIWIWASDHTVLLCQQRANSGGSAALQEAMAAIVTAGRATKIDAKVATRLHGSFKVHGFDEVLERLQTGEFEPIF